MKTFVANVLFLVFLSSPIVTTAFSIEAEDKLLADKPVWFTLDTTGGVYGETERGSRFTQTPVLLDASVRMQKFTMGSISYYISDRGVIDAPNDLMALSIYFSLG